MLAEIGALQTESELIAWAKNNLPRKNTLIEADARTIEAAFQGQFGNAALATADLGDGQSQSDVESQTIPCRSETAPKPAPADLAFPKEPARKRSKAHLLFVRGQACLICKQTPCDAHHLKFAQPRALGRKVSDEFTVPLCRSHHRDLHRNGNEKAWWADMQIAPLPVAKDLWTASPVHEAASAAPLNGGHPSTLGKKASPR
jgi:hypothetical protein